MTGNEEAAHGRPNGHVLFCGVSDIVGLLYFLLRMHGLSFVFFAEAVIVSNLYHVRHDDLLLDLVLLVMSGGTTCISSTQSLMDRTSFAVLHWRLVRDGHMHASTVKSSRIVSMTKLPCIPRLYLETQVLCHLFEPCPVSWTTALSISLSYPYVHTRPLSRA